ARWDHGTAAVSGEPAAGGGEGPDAGPGRGSAGGCGGRFGDVRAAAGAVVRKSAVARRAGAGNATAVQGRAARHPDGGNALSSRKESPARRGRSCRRRLHGCREIGSDTASAVGRVWPVVVPGCTLVA